MEIEQAYRILGVPKGAPEAEVRTTYRRLAKELHPDGGGSAAEFRLIEEAFTLIATAGFPERDPGPEFQHRVFSREDLAAAADRAWQRFTSEHPNLSIADGQRVWDRAAEATDFDQLLAAMGGDLDTASHALLDRTLLELISNKQVNPDGASDDRGDGRWTRLSIGWLRTTSWLIAIGPIVVVFTGRHPDWPLANQLFVAGLVAFPIGTAAGILLVVEWTRDIWNS